ncbi:MAG: metallophosphoesterase family protein [Oxalicibacterium faecigallinarum]|uniref:metallophosphoesterase family protein n=1 Tax=Oxalicibacterium faecigallinarum TaxID=573741 RepID=UPI00280951A5|nr:metallophosphoesterase family protein [Oxalicibacterium faecigallinarum]MDQ7968125.1 metallophosphoesterase family protein [Oxalicibacterium faecigallinarum]
MTVILHISDSHFGTERAPVVAALQRLSSEQAPDLVILSGDITQRALRTEFEAARDFIDRLEVPSTLVIPGNHDIPLFDLVSRFFTPYGRYARSFGNELEPVYTSPDVLVIGVNTTRRYRHVQGEVSRAQRDDVATRLRRAQPAQLRIVVTHQPVHVTRPEDRENLLRGHEEAIRTWAAAGADLILGGHIHRPSISPLHASMPNLPRRMWAVQAGTALSSRIRFDAGNSVNIIRYQASQPEHCLVERWDYADKADAFRLTTAEQLARDT